jgi:asparagine synthase (glutamine-hydrolysing)
MMCGICGFVVPSSEPIDIRAGRAMRDVLAHRGPDEGTEAQLWGAEEGRLHGWFGHRRLRIIDLSEAARQPMAAANGSVVLTYNGEVYNFRQLRRELVRRGHRFRSTGDSEVVLRAYEEWGEGFVHRIDGMFAVAVWDGRAEKLVLARDRPGKKPLFYATDGARITFGSEIKSLMMCPWISKSLSPRYIPQFLTFGYVPEPHTLLEGIIEVPPASLVVFDRHGIRDPERYWEPLPSGRPLRLGADTLSTVRGLVRGATERRMISDVPLGASLSGGIDSSIVVGLMSELAVEPVHTFSIGFPEDPSYDETHHAALVARHFNTHHTEFDVRVDAVALLDHLVWHHDGPFGDSSAIPTFVVSQLASQEVTVLLTGDGGDEVFGGYDRFVAAALAGRMPRFAARAVGGASRLLPNSHGYFSLRRRLLRFAELPDHPVKDRYVSWVALVNPQLLAELVAPDLREAARPDVALASINAAYARAAELPELDQILFANFVTYLPDDLAVKADRMSMAHSLEVRSPFLDTAVVEYLARLPARKKVGLRKLKPILREAFGPLLPRSIWERRKHGFGVPVGTWFRGELGEMFEDEVLAENARTAQFLNRDKVHELWGEHREARVEHGFRLWALLTLEHWLRSLDRSGSHPPPASRLGIDVSTFASRSNACPTKWGRSPPATQTGGEGSR